MQLFVTVGRHVVSGIHLRPDATSLEAVTFHILRDDLTHVDDVTRGWSRRCRRCTINSAGHVVAAVSQCSTPRGFCTDADALAAVRQPTPLVCDKYRNDPAVLAEWESAQHHEIAPSSAKAGRLRIAVDIRVAP